MQHQNYASELIAILAQAGAPSTVTTAYVSARLGVAWRTISKRLLGRSGVQQAFAVLGWRYQPALGRRGGHFVRTQPSKAQELSEALGLPWPTIVGALLFYGTAAA